MSRHVKLRTMSSREFNQNTSSAKHAADEGPLLITDRGNPAYVLMTNAEFERLTQRAQKPKRFISVLEIPRAEGRAGV